MSLGQPHITGTWAWTGLNLLSSLLLLTSGGCNDPSLQHAERYLQDGSYRREVLERSLVNRDNGYARMRLDAYAVSNVTPSGWDTLPEWNPATRPLREDPSTEAPFLLTFSGETPQTEGEWLALGQRAFETYPVQLNQGIRVIATDTEAREHYGLWKDARGHLGGLAEVQLAGAQPFVALTCATCHARTDAEARLEPGLPNQDFDLGAIAARNASADDTDALLSWGPGRVDVTQDAMVNPVAIPDLRPIRHQRYLHSAATLENSLEALAVRIETLIITSMNQEVRPPRQVAFALALYLWRMSDAPSHNRIDDTDDAALFERECGFCHGAEGASSGRISLAGIQTDPAVGLSPMRGTGFYRIPSLWGVGDRERLLHDLSVDNLDHLLDPTRQSTDHGHPFGLTLSAAERTRLLRFVRRIGSSTHETSIFQ